MKPLELSSIKEVWKSALKIVGDNISDIGKDLQLWFPWGRIWRGQDKVGSLPPTALPEELTTGGVNRFGGRLWKSVSVNGTSWLLSIKAPVTQTAQMENWAIPEKALDSLKMLGEFVKLEGLLGLSMKILENRANEHEGHWDRVRNFSLAIGRELELKIQELADLELAAMLHDIGKVGLSDDILNSVGPLSEESRKKMESHSIVGSTMIREIPGMSRIADYVLYHHESPDGTGYPKGKKAGEIPLGALIISVADAFDAMTHYRPYATEKTYKECFQEMKDQKGRFDITVLNALEKVLIRLGIIDSKPMVGTFED
jgi:HD-GYP domain-containing protein (c-di-GMP phosphodiesterase class II)